VLHRHRSSQLKAWNLSVSTLTAAACADLEQALTEIAVAASRAILKNAGIGTVRSKADGSPVTAADEAADTLIHDSLARLVPGLPVISEEAATRQAPSPIAGGSYFLVDPLDGTSDFIAGRNEYTVNIAIMTDRAPVLGIIVAPALGLIWRGVVGQGAVRLAFGTGVASIPPQTIHARQPAPASLTVMVSRSHLEPRTKAYVDQLPVGTLEPSGSSIKFCRLAEGSADLYPRLAPTHDWDTAAGHAILTAAGGKVMAPSGAPLVYGSKDLIIPAFVAWADPARAAPIKG
jgi:3'(2'), 5'-bisphosphate nucleotidase